MGTDPSSDPAPAGLAVTPGPSIDAKLAMALNVHNCPGVYALLLGSGISIASGVKTGWGIVVDLVAKVAAVREPGDPQAGVQAAADPEKWWETTFGEPLGYSTLLEHAAPTPAARQALLDAYFVPTAGEETTDKVPTAAHRAIARMVKRGSFRVILTTNFDRLMERALTEVGISAQVISHPDQIDAIKPLPHSQITIVKLHGDYDGLGQRNTVAELKDYPEAQQKLLERVLDEYGLIVCGWSADWDKALVQAMEGSRSRRYPLFWSTYGALGDAARRLTVQHGAGVIAGLDADELFTDLERRLEALDSMAAPPVSRDMAVAQLKKALPDPLRRIDLFDLVQQHTLQVVDAVAKYPVFGDNDAFAQAVEGYQADTDTLLHLLATGVFHDDGTYNDLWLRTVGRLASTRNTILGSFQDHMEKLRHYPALLATWSMGIAAVLAHREEFIVDLLTKPLWTPPLGSRKREEPSWYLNPWNVLYGDSIHIVSHSETGGRLKYPYSRLINAAVREPLRAVEPDDRAFEAASARFQFLTSLIGMDASDWRSGPWVGEFLLDSWWGYDNNGLAAEIQQEITTDWPLLRAGAFAGDINRANAAFTALTQWRSSNRHS
ncbi:SIR2 family protein [Kitasatospora indigofera]|uniref:SIR2 family protein n=1 Tax=Kitasatospora indigofera TaxID=67307 RepID=UPI003637BA28